MIISCAALFILLAVIAISFIGVSPTACAVTEYETLIMKREGRILSPDKASVAELYGTYSDKSLFAKKLRILIKNKESGATIAQIDPIVNAGYSPSIILGNFTDADKDQIFLGINGGGSGGFGYYYVYDVTEGAVKTLFDSEKCGINYSAKYADGYKVAVKNELGGEIYTIDISGKGAQYLSELYGDDEKLLKPVAAQVYPVGTVFPYYNPAFAEYQLAAFSQISGLYHADGLGNVIALMRYNGKSFEPYFENVGGYGY